MVRVADAESGKNLPVTVIISDGGHPDGAGRGTYSDGRFCAEGEFSVEVTPGSLRVAISSGPDYVPLEETVAVAAGELIRAEVRLRRWFDPRSRGYWCGDNHVHAQHDATADVRTDLEYTALQARANGLDFLTEARSNVSYEGIEELSRPDFLLSSAYEGRIGAFVGHFNTPGAPDPAPGIGPLPARELVENAHNAGGAVIYTHPLAPPTQLHWMGATQMLSDAVLGQCADAMDIRSPAEEHLWYLLLNLGNRIAASSSTDACLGRRGSPRPGAHRIYVQGEALDYAHICGAIRAGRTFATDGGPVFAFLTVDGQPPGSEIRAERGRTYRAQMEVAALRPLKSVALLRRGAKVREFENPGRGTLAFTHDFAEGGEAWYVLRAEDDEGKWAITSPVYFAAPVPHRRPPAGLVLLEIGNFTGFIELRRQFFAHVIATAWPGPITVVRLLRDGTPLYELAPWRGDKVSAAGTPCTGVEGEFQEGWVWWPGPAGAQHFQMDAPVAESGWYQVEVETAAGQSCCSHAIYFDSRHPKSRQLSSAVLSGGGNHLALAGYGEEMPLDRINLPFEGDHWWYPDRQYWHLQVVLDDRPAFEHTADGEAAALFRLEGR